MIFYKNIKFSEFYKIIKETQSKTITKFSREHSVSLETVKSYIFALRWLDENDHLQIMSFEKLKEIEREKILNFNGFLIRDNNTFYEINMYNIFTLEVLWTTIKGLNKETEDSFAHALGFNSFKDAKFDIMNLFSKLSVIKGSLKIGSFTEMDLKTKLGDLYNTKFTSDTNEINIKLGEIIDEFHLAQNKIKFHQVNEDVARLNDKRGAPLLNLYANEYLENTSEEDPSSFEIQDSSYQYEVNEVNNVLDNSINDTFQQNIYVSSINQTLNYQNAEMKKVVQQKADYLLSLKQKLKNLTLMNNSLLQSLEYQKLINEEQGNQSNSNNKKRKLSEEENANASYTSVPNYYAFFPAASSAFSTSVASTSSTSVASTSSTSVASTSSSSSAFYANNMNQYNFG